MRYKLTITSVLLILFLVAVIIQSRLDESTASRRRVFSLAAFASPLLRVLVSGFLNRGRSVIATTRGRRELWTTARFKRGLFNDVRIAVVRVHATTGGGTRPSTSTARSSSSSSSSPDDCMGVLSTTACVVVRVWNSSRGAVYTTAQVR